MVSHREKSVGAKAIQKKNRMSLRSSEKGSHEGHDASVDQYLKSMYYTPSGPGSFSGISKLWLAIQNSKERPAKITRKMVKDWLDKQDVHLWQGW